MPRIKPFRCIHPADGLWQQVAALPYDVYNRAEAREAVAGKPLSFLNIDRPETQFPETQDMYAAEVYEKAGEMLRQEIADGVFVQEPEEVYYLYELTMDGRKQCGIVVGASIDDYLEGSIRKHENTRAEKEEDRIRHVDTCDHQTGPIFLSYRQTDKLRELSLRVREGEPVFDFTSEDGITHRGWKVADAADIAVITDETAAMEALYIADGHHRAASAVKVGLKRRAEKGTVTGEEEFNYFLSVMFPDEELMIMDYNRVIKDLKGMTAQELLEKIGGVCDIKPEAEAVKPAKKGEAGLYLDDQWYRLSFKDEVKSDDPVEGLDVSILQNTILGPILGIQDPKTDPAIDFVGGIRGLQELERRVHTDCKAAFSMYPTSIAELFSVADDRKLMPPKSTWFEPKLRSGLFLHSLS